MGGPHPPTPPPDLSETPLPLHTCPGETVLHRIHRTDKQALFFGPPVGMKPLGRWDAPDGTFRTCYFAERPETAFAEVFLRNNTAARRLAPDLLAASSLTRVVVLRDLRLVACHDEGLARLGATAAVSSGSHRVSQRWAFVLHGHPNSPDGIRYRARHDEGFAVALFHRADSAVRVETTTALLDTARADDLSDWANRYSMSTD